MATANATAAAAFGHRTRRRKSYMGMLADAGIMSCLAFFGSLGASALLPIADGLRFAVYTGVIAAGNAFFLQLAIERGLRGN